MDVVKPTKLKLNSDKTRFIWLGSRQQPVSIIMKKSPLKGHGVMTSPCSADTCFYQLCQLRSIRGQPYGLLQHHPVPGGGRSSSSFQSVLNAATRLVVKGAITSKIKHAIKLKTSPARLAQLLHNCCSPH